MINLPIEPPAAEVRSLLAALALARHARWCLAHVGPVVAKPFSQYLYVDAAQLLVIPSSMPLERTMAYVGVGMRRTRSDALIVSAPGRPGGEIRLAVGIWGRRENRWHAPMALWRETTGPLWIVPDPYHAAVRRDCFPLHPGRLRASGAPWSDGEHHGAGRLRAHLWIGRTVDD